MKDLDQVDKGYFYSDECNLSDFKKVINQNISEQAVPNATEIKQYTHL